MDFSMWTAKILIRVHFSALAKLAYLALPLRFSYVTPALSRNLKKQHIYLRSYSKRQTFIYVLMRYNVINKGNQ